MSLDKANPPKEKKEVKQTYEYEITEEGTEPKKYSLIKEKFLDLKKKYQKEESTEIPTKEENPQKPKKISVPKEILKNYYIEKESNDTQQENNSHNNSINLDNSANNKNDYLNLSESVIKRLPSFLSQRSFSSGKNDDLLSSIDFDQKKSKFIKEYEISTFPEENQEDEYSEENNIYTNTQKIKNKIPVLKENEFIEIEKETKPLIEKYEKYFSFNSQDSSDIIITQTKIKQKNESSSDSMNDNKNNKSSNVIKKIYYEYDDNIDNNIKGEKYLNDFIKKKWKYFVKLFIIEKNRKADEYRRFILQALMKYQFRKSFGNKITEEEEINEIKRRVKKRKKQYSKNGTNVDLIKNEPLIDLINEDEIVDDVNLFRKQKKYGINTKEIETKTLTKIKRIDEQPKNVNSKIKNKLIDLVNKHKNKQGENEEEEEYEEEIEEEDDEDEEEIKKKKEGNKNDNDNSGKNKVKKKIIKRIIKNNNNNVNKGEYEEEIEEEEENEDMKEMERKNQDNHNNLGKNKVRRRIIRITRKKMEVI